MRLGERRAALEALLQESAPLWQPSTFREARPAWCAEQPELTAALLALDDATLAALEGDAAQALVWLSPMLPVLQLLAPLTALPVASVADAESANPADARANRDIPGRKLGQIDAFVAAVGRPQARLVEWCAGKGHLGRRFLIRWGGDALAVERDAALCASGESLARMVRHPQRFLAADVLAAPTAETLRGAHAIALHACGDLHRRLVKAAAAVRAPAIDLAPCCYQLTAAPNYVPLAAPSALKLDRDALKLAVTETVTATPRQAALSAQGSAWKLAFVDLRQRLSGDAGYRPFRPVPASWQAAGFAAYLDRLAAREGLTLPAGFDYAACEASGWTRHHASRRLQLVRMAFRRGIEVWLLADLAVWLENQGYAVTLREFCERVLTPRNLLLSARLL